MLFLKQKVRGGIAIGPDIVVLLMGAQGGEIRLGIHAPKELKVVRAGPFTEEQMEARIQLLSKVPH